MHTKLSQNHTHPYKMSCTLVYLPFSFLCYKHSGCDSPNQVQWVTTGNLKTIDLDKAFYCWGTQDFPTLLYVDKI